MMQPLFVPAKVAAQMVGLTPKILSQLPIDRYKPKGRVLYELADIVEYIRSKREAVPCQRKKTDFIGRKTAPAGMLTPPIKASAFSAALDARLKRMHAERFRNGKRK